MRLILGTRGSDLARTQSGSIAEQLRRVGVEIEMRYIRTSGDNSTAPTFASVGPQGVFVREIEQALSAGDIDLAVHSYKDLPTASPDDLIIAAVPKRLNPADVLVTCHAHDGTDQLLPLPQGATVGTSSARRQQWLHHLRPDLRPEPLRGNLPTRLRRLKDGDYDGIILAAAGIERLREDGDLLTELVAALHITPLDTARFVPAPSQGALAIQCRAADDEIVQLLGSLDDAASHAAVTEERTALALAEGGCDTAFGAHCVVGQDGAALTIMLERAGTILSNTITAGAVHGLGARAWESLA